MTSDVEIRFSEPVSVFRERRLPERARPAGYAALIGAYGLKVPLPRVLSAIGERHRVSEQGGWRILTPRHAPRPTLEGHLTFALRYEGLDLAVLKRLFLETGAAPIEALVRAAPTGSYARRIWFLYEWLLGVRLDLPDAKAGRYADVLDTSLQWGGGRETVSRHRLKNNLPGSPDFCPLAFRSNALIEFAAMDLRQRALEIISEVPKDILSRAAAFLLLKDSRSSYVIEGERPPRDRIQRWSRAIGEAGRRALDKDELPRLQRIVIGDDRFVRLGFRTEGGFVGEHDRETHAPLPDHIGARPEDLPSLLTGLIAFDRGRARQMDPVIAAALLAFGFVYIHPFDDGNGRIHRYLMHHILARHGFSPPDLVFPISAAILDAIDRYREVLEGYSARLLPLVEWETSDRSNVRVLNDTGDFYRFFDATPHAEFLYECVRRTIEQHLPAETAFLRRYDAFRGGVQSLVDMPERTVGLLFKFLRQNEGMLSTRARQGEFAALTEREVEQIQRIYDVTLADR